MKRIIGAVLVLIGVAAMAVGSAGAGGTDHPDCEGRVEIEVNAPSFTVPAEYDGWTVWTKAGNNPHRDQGAAETVTSNEFNDNGKERDISHVDLCPPTTSTTTTISETTTTTIPETTTTTPFDRGTTVTVDPLADHTQDENEVPQPEVTGKTEEEPVRTELPRTGYGTGLALLGACWTASGAILIALERRIR